MASITASGLGSGLDVNSLVDQLVAAEADPAAQRFDRQEVELQAELSAYGSLKGSLSALQGAVSRLAALSTFQAKSVTTANSDQFTASASSVAATGRYTVEVTGLAQAHSLATPAGQFADITDTVGTGTLTFRFGTTAYDPNVPSYSFTPDDQQAAREVTIDDGSLEGIRDAVNAAAIGVTASIVNDGSGYRLLFVSNDTGAKTSMEITVAEDAGSPGLSVLAFNASATNLEQTVAAQDAALKINGLAITRASNTVTEAIHGVTLNLLATGVGNPVELDVALNEVGVNSAVDGFISAYNEFVKTVDTLSRYDPDTGQAGVLLGDATLRGIGVELRRLLGSTVAGSGTAYGSLAQVGITTLASARDDGEAGVSPGGSLQLDSAAFARALADDPDAVARLFAASEGDPPTRGIADRINTLLTRFLDDDGVIETSSGRAQRGIDDIGEQRKALADRLQSLEDRYRAQFTALDVLLTRMRTTSEFLTQQLAALPTFQTRRR